MHTDQEMSAAATYQHCPLCHSDNITEAFVGLDRMYGKAGRFPVFHCHDCNLYFLGNKLTIEELGNFYPDTYYAYEGSQHKDKKRSYFKTKELELRRRVEQKAFAIFLGYPSPEDSSFLVTFLAKRKKKKFEQLPPYTESGHLLDVGCGGGTYLSAMRKLGWNVEGVEPGHSGCEACRAQNIQVHEGTLEDANLPSESFDFIRFEHVLEHVPEPLPTLKEAKRILKPGGTIRVMVPNMRSIPARWFGTYWYHLDTPRHLFWFSADTITLLAKETGLKISRISVETDHSDIADSLIYWLNDHVPALGKRMGRRKLLWKLCNKLTLPIKIWMNMTATGSLLIVSMTKEEDQ